MSPTETTEEDSMRNRMARLALAGHSVASMPPLLPTAPLPVSASEVQPRANEPVAPVAVVAAPPQPQPSAPSEPAAAAPATAFAWAPAPTLHPAPPPPLPPPAPHT